LQTTHSTAAPHIQPPTPTFNRRPPHARSRARKLSTSHLPPVIPSIPLSIPGDDHTLYSYTTHYTHTLYTLLIHYTHTLHTILIHYTLYSYTLLIHYTLYSYTTHYTLYSYTTHYTLCSFQETIRARKMESELAECKFKPTINPGSKKYIRGRKTSPRSHMNQVWAWQGMVGEK
jgi:hypothetical protein